MAFLNFLDVWGLGNRGMFRTIRDLVLRPGYMIRDYLKGMQMAYFPPFNMFFLLTDAKAVKWGCTGSPDYEMEETEKAERGTDIVLHIAEDSMEFCDEPRIVSLLRKYCRFLPVEIQCGEESKWEKPEKAADSDEEPKEVEVKVPRIINNTTNPLWKSRSMT